MIAGAVAETAAVLRERIVAIAAHKLEAAPDDIELGRQPGHGAGHADVAAVAGRDRRHRLLRARRRCPTGVPAGPGGERPLPAESPTIWANATHVCTCEVDVDDRRGARCCATSSARTAAR